MGDFKAKNFIQLISEPTHCQGNTLDLILTNSPHRLQNIQVHSPEASLQSDHFLITTSILSSPSRPHATFTYTECPLNYAKADKPGLINHAANLLEPLQYLLPTSTPNIETI